MKWCLRGLSLLVISTTAFPATPDAWGEAFSHMETECRALVSDGERQLDYLNAIVDGYNGIVILIGVNHQGDEKLAVCVYDFGKKTASLGDSISLDSLRPSY